MSKYKPLQSPLDLASVTPIAASYTPDDISVDWSESGVGSLEREELSDHWEAFFRDSPSRMSIVLPGESSPTDYRLFKIHFHSGIEHEIGYSDSEIELHIVHTATEPDPFDPADDRTVYAVVGVQVIGGATQESKADRILHQVYEAFQAKSALDRAQEPPVELDIDPKELIPYGAREQLTDAPLWRYEGSLTTETDPGKQNTGFVSWVVLQPRLQVTDKTIEEWRHIQHGRRPVEHLNRRFVFFSPGKIPKP